MPFLYKCLSAVAISASAAALVTTVTVTIDGSGTEFIGTTQNGVDSFRGIQYAQAEHRFEPSIPVVYDTSITAVNATSFGTKCYQPTGFGPPPGPPPGPPSSGNETSFGPPSSANESSLMPPPPPDGTSFMPPPPPPDISEDCLYLNIYRPTSSSNADADLLPVMFWVHGGGFVSGSGIEPVYDGSALASQEKVVVVTINYRLGVFGLLTLNETGAGAMNFLRDQIHGLMWVQRYIASFGGDPEQVTVFGESAGSGSACLLAVSPLAKGLMHRAILQSGTCMNDNYPAGIEEGWQRTQNLLDSSGVSSVKDLAAFPPQQLTTLAMREIGGPAVDGHVIPAHPVELYRSGQINARDMIIGATTSDDVFLLFMPGGAYIAASRRLESQIHDRFDETHGAEASERCVRAYSVTDVYDGSHVTAHAQFRGDSLFLCYSRELAAITASHGIQTFVYYFGHWSANDPAAVSNVLTMAGLEDPTWASHTAELPYVFGNLDFTYSGPAPNPPTAADKAVSRELMERWAAFARGGNPNMEGSVQWEAVPADTPMDAESASNVAALALFSDGQTDATTTAFYMTTPEWKTEQCSSIPGIDMVRTASTNNDGTSLPPGSNPSPTKTSAATGPLWLSWCILCVGLLVNCVL